VSSILVEAEGLVHGPRQGDYGHPFDNYSDVARIWSVILRVDVTPEQAALCMAGVKMAREAYRPKRDNRVDLAGYTEVVDMIHAERERRNRTHIDASADVSALDAPCYIDALPI
jgi:hypothetical protein